MKDRWSELFGKDYYLILTNEERKYLALDPLEDKWETTSFYSKTNLWHKRTTVYWDNDVIKKVIVEQKKISKEGKLIYNSYQEDDTELLTESRQWLLPLTSRGKKKKVTATNILSVEPFGCTFHFHLDLYDGVHTSFSIDNYRNNKRMPAGETKRIDQIRNDADFHTFMQYYMSTCPPDYFDDVKRLRTAEHVTVKYSVGDVFRVKTDRFHYCYGIITGKVRDILKWKEMPNRHTFHSLMMVPVMVRYYGLMTTDADITVDELESCKLGRVDICGDNDIIWGTHPIIGHRQLREEDIEFNLVCAKLIRDDEHKTVTADDFNISEKIIECPRRFSLYVEWGMATTILTYDKISEKLEAYLENYRCPHGGVAPSIHPMLMEDETETVYAGNPYMYWYDLLNDSNREFREELFICLGLSKAATFDDFAGKFGGMTKAEIMERIRG